MKTSDLFVRCLENEGVKYVFGLPGEENEDLLFSLEKSAIKFIPTRHEQGAAFMADVWGRLTGKAGVCLATLGPGATNLITGIADATLDKSPVVAITGQGSIERLHQESHQHLDIVSMFKPITKWNAAITDPDIVCEVVRKAFKIAENEKPGATHIELSEDVAKMDSQGRPLTVKKFCRPYPDPSTIAEAIGLIMRSKRPLIIAGNGAIRKMASKELRTLSEQFGIPVVSTLMGKGAISAKSPQCLFTIGFGFRDLVMEAVDAADLILTVGYDIAEYAPEKWNCADKTVIHIDFTPAEVYKHYQPDLEIAADISSSLRSLVQKLTETSLMLDSQWYASIRKTILDDINSYELKDGQKFTIPGTICLLNTCLNDQDLLISDVGSHKIWIGRNYLTSSPNGCIISNGLASMGISLPGAVAAALENPNRRVVAAMGDGGFLMNSQELETAKRLGVNFTTIIFNDNDYGLISWKQTTNVGRSFGTKLTNPDFKAYAESFGIKAYRPTTVKELKLQLKEALDSKTLNVIEIPVDTKVNYELSMKTRKLKCAKQYVEGGC